MTGLADRSAELLSKTKLFGDLPPDAIIELAHQCRWDEVDTGHLFIDSSRKQPHGVFVLADGKAEVFRPDASGAALPIATLEAVDCFGEFAAIHGTPGSASVRSITRCSIGEVPAPAFLSMVADRPNLAFGLLRHLVGTIRDLDDEVATARGRDALFAGLSRNLFLSTL